MAEVVQTVLGPVDPSVLGRTLTHEHISLDFLNFQFPPPDNIKKYVEGKITMENIGFIQRYPYSNYENVAFNDGKSQEAFIYDLNVFKQLGGGTIVENTSHGLKRRADLFRDLSQKTGVHIVAGTGHYVHGVQSSDALKQSVEELHDIIIQDMTVGLEECPQVKAGFIGEVGSSYPIHDFEKRAIKATALAQSQLKCAVSFHPGRNRDAPFEIMRHFCEAGGDPKKTIMSHLDRTLPKIEDFLEFASEFHCYCQQDLFGTEVLTYQFEPNTQMPSDYQRILTIKTMVENGLADRILMSHDLHLKCKLLKYGGHGYCHLFANVLPKMLAVGISQDVIDQITERNPQTWLKWKPS